MADLRCPSCGEDSDLQGSRGQSGIRITCGGCGYAWDRDARRRCATCGGWDIVTRPRTLTAFSRGTQLSMHGWYDVPLCFACDHEEYMRSTRSGGPLAPDYVSAAVHRRGEPREPS